MVTVPPFCSSPPAPLMTDTAPSLIVTLPFVSARTPKSLPLPPTERFTLVAVIALPAPVAQSPVSPPPEEETELLIVLFERLMLPPF